MSVQQVVAILEECGVAPEVIAEVMSSWTEITHNPALEDLEDTVIHSDSSQGDKVSTFTGSTGASALENWTASDPLERYTILEKIGHGGMGEVYKVYDKMLRRQVAMKTIHAKLIPHSYILSHFIEEAQVIAQLQHPNIIPIYDFGKTPEGGFYYTMIEVRGIRFDQAIRAVHKAMSEQAWIRADNGWTFHRLISVFLRVCEAVAFAHEMGVLHRDLKPENIMIGSFDAVFVMDWGIAKVIGSTEQLDGEEVIETERSEHQEHQTQVGQVTGTPAYMSPEQARGEVEMLGVGSDVYSLGAVLHEILFGAPPYLGKNVLHRMIAREPTILQRYLNGDDCEGHTFLSHMKMLPPLPHELLSVCKVALSYDAQDRYSSVAELALLIRAWLEGSQKREHALKIVREALAKNEETQRLQWRAARLQDEAQELLQEVHPWAPEHHKQEAWRREDEARLLDEEVALIETEHEQLLRAALTHKADLPEAHLALARYYQTQHQRQRGGIEQKKIELRLRQHAQALPRGAGPSGRGHRGS